jgi:hypothetical protein
MYHNAYRGSTATDIASTAAFSGEAVPDDLSTLQVRLDRLNCLDLKGAVTGLILLHERLGSATLEVRTRYEMLRAIKAMVLRVAAALPKVRAGAPSRVGASSGPNPGSAPDPTPSPTPSLTLEQRLYDTMASN